METVRYQITLKLFPEPIHYWEASVDWSLCLQLMTDRDFLHVWCMGILTRLMHGISYTSDARDFLHVWCTGFLTRLMHGISYTSDARDFLQVWCTGFLTRLMHGISYTSDARDFFHVWCTWFPTSLMHGNMIYNTLLLWFTQFVFGPLEGRGWGGGVSNSVIRIT